MTFAIRTVRHLCHAIRGVPVARYLLGDTAVAVLGVAAMSRSGVAITAASRRYSACSAGTAWARVVTASVAAAISSVHSGRVNRSEHIASAPPMSTAAGSSTACSSTCRFCRLRAAHGHGCRSFRALRRHGASIAWLDPVACHDHAVLRDAHEHCCGLTHSETPARD